MQRVFFVCFLLTVFLSHFKISLLDLSIPTNCRAKERKMSCIMGEKGVQPQVQLLQGAEYSRVSTNVLVGREFIF